MCLSSFGRTVTRSAHRCRPLLLAMLTLALALAAAAGPALAAAPTDFIIKGRGYGHGVGMSQWGAWAAARDGRDFRWILGFYYPGTALDPLADLELKVKLSSEPARAISELTQDFTQVDLNSSVAGAEIVGAGAAGELQQAVPAGTPVNVFPAAGKIEVSIAGAPRVGPYDWVELRPQAGGRVVIHRYAGANVHQTEYRGKARVQPSATAGRLNAYNLVMLEGYIRAIAEVEYDWANSTSSRYAPEAVKAQAVAARTYAYANKEGLEDNQRDQVYRGYTFEAQYPGIAQAAADTAGLVLKFNGSVISAFYSSSSGGYTSKWSSEPAPPAYRPLQPDPYSLQAPPGNPGFGWTLTVSQEELSQKAGGLRGTDGRILDLGTVTKLEVASRETADAGSHAATLRLTGTKGTGLLKAESLRAAFGYSRMRSTLLTEVRNPGFSDVPPEHYYWQQIMRAAAEGLVSGYPDESFRPENAVSRWQFAKMAVNLHNKLLPGSPIAVTDVSAPPFLDMVTRAGEDESDWVSAAKTAGLVMGGSDGRFHPYDPVRRDQMASMILRAMGWEDEAAALAPGTPGFADVPAGSPHAAAATYLKSLGVLAGYEQPPGSGSFLLDAAAVTKRMHIAVILGRILDLD